MVESHRWQRGVLLSLLLLFALSACARPPQKPDPHGSLVYETPGDGLLLERFAPVFIVENGKEAYNRIGRPYAFLSAAGEQVAVDPETAVLYAGLRSFTTPTAAYTNLLYRVHFTEVPFSLLPFHLTAGKNVGLLVVVTLDAGHTPVLYTLVHTCGCYLAFVATSDLPRRKWKEGWREGRQVVYGENLPMLLDFKGEETGRIAVHIGAATHRIKNIWRLDQGELGPYSRLRARIQPLAALEYLQLDDDGSTTSFYEESGSRRGYVKGSHKIWERLLMGWWALDWRVGEDKKLGRDLSDGTVFYTSLKPWAREESDMRDFARFLRYWGWRL